MHLYHITLAMHSITQIEFDTYNLLIYTYIYYIYLYSLIFIFIKYHLVTDFFQSNSNVVVVQNQPSVTRSPFQSTQDHYLTLGIVLTILCAISGMWHSLLCTVPAIIFSIMVILLLTMHVILNKTNILYNFKRLL